MEKISGIYKIENTINKKLYIGSSYNIKLRWYKHKYQLKNNKHPNKHLQYAINKYKLEIFNFEIIEECLESELLKREQYYIDFYKNKNTLYNVDLIAGSRRKQHILKICKQCKIHFEVASCFKNQIFCSKKCTDKSFTHNIIVNCKNCNKKIKLIKSELKRNHGKFCSRKCTINFKRKNPTGIFIKCKLCNTLFKTKKSKLKNGRGKYCSKQCASESYKK